MIPRYSRPEMTAIWEPENKFRIWFEIEAIIDLPPGVDAEGIESSLRFWTSKDSRSELIFDTFTQQVTPFSHA